MQGRIAYRGPLQPGGDLPRVKLDLTADELLVSTPEMREVFHPYSDCPGIGIHALCYSFDEVLAEKLRALAQRLRPRDLYDIVPTSQTLRTRERTEPRGTRGLQRAA